MTEDATGLFEGGSDMSFAQTKAAISETAASSYPPSAEACVHGDGAVSA
jgi:hypothetical protein